MVLRFVAVITAVALVGQEAAFAAEQPKAARVAWSELAPLVVDKRIAMKLADGTKLRGEVIAVRPETMLIDVSKTSRKDRWPRGQTEIPRNLVPELRLVKHDAAMKALFGTMGGIATALGVGFGAAASESVILATVGIIGLVPLGVVAGYYAGQALGQQKKTIRVVN